MHTAFDTPTMGRHSELLMTGMQQVVQRDHEFHLAQRIHNADIQFGVAR